MFKPVDVNVNSSNLVAAHKKNQLEYENYRAINAGVDDTFSSDIDEDNVFEQDQEIPLQQKKFAFASQIVSLSFLLFILKSEDSLFSYFLQLSKS